MANNGLDDSKGLSAFGMRGIDEEHDLFCYHLLAVLDSPFLERALAESKLRRDVLLKAGYWLCWLANGDGLPDDEVLVEEIGSEEGLHAAAALAWAIARRLVSQPPMAATRRLRTWMNRSLMGNAMEGFAEHCSANNLRSCLPDTESDIVDKPHATRLGIERRKVLQRNTQSDALTTVMQQINIVAEHVTINDIHDNKSINM